MKNIKLIILCFICITVSVFSAGGDRVALTLDGGLYGSYEKDMDQLWLSVGAGFSDVYSDMISSYSGLVVGTDLKYKWIDNLALDAKGRVYINSLMGYYIRANVSKEYSANDIFSYKPYAGLAIYSDIYNDLTDEKNAYIISPRGGVKLSFQINQDFKLLASVGLSYNYTSNNYYDDDGFRFLGDIGFDWEISNQFNLSLLLPTEGLKLSYRF